MAFRPKGVETNLYRKRTPEDLLNPSMNAEPRQFRSFDDKRGYNPFLNEQTNRNPYVNQGRINHSLKSPEFEPSLNRDSFQSYSKPVKNEVFVKSFITSKTEKKINPPMIYPNETLKKIIFTHKMINMFFVLVSTFILLKIVLWINTNMIPSKDYFEIKNSILLILLIFLRSLVFKSYDDYISSEYIIRSFLGRAGPKHFFLMLHFLIIVSITYNVLHISSNYTANEEGYKIIFSILLGLSLTHSYITDKADLLNPYNHETFANTLKIYYPKSLLIRVLNAFWRNSIFVAFVYALGYFGVLSFFLERFSNIFGLSQMRIEFLELDKAVLKFFTFLYPISLLNLIINLQTEFSRKISMRLVSWNSDAEPLYYFQNIRMGETEILAFCLRNIDVYRKYECRYNLRRRYNNMDSDSNTVWQTFFENGIERLRKSISNLETLQTSEIIKIKEKKSLSYMDYISRIQAYFNMTPKLNELNSFYQQIKITEHFTLVLTRCFQELVLLGSDKKIGNFDHQIRIYYEFLRDTLTSIGDLRIRIDNIYISDFIEKIQSFEERTKQNLCMIDMISRKL